MFTVRVANFHEKHQAEAALASLLVGHPELVGHIEEQIAQSEPPDPEQVDDLSDPQMTPPAGPASIAERMKEQAEAALEQKPGLTPVDQLK